MKETVENCFKDKWMDEAFPNPHQVEMCSQRMQNKHMGHFYRNMVNIRESNKYKYMECVKTAENNYIDAVKCVRNYISGIDADNVTLKSLVEANSAKYFWADLETNMIEIFKHQLKRTHFLSLSLFAFLSIYSYTLNCVIIIKKYGIILR